MQGREPDASPKVESGGDPQRNSVIIANSRLPGKYETSFQKARFRSLLKSAAPTELSGLGIGIL